MAITYDHKGRNAGNSPAGLFVHRITFDVGGDTYTTNGLVFDWTDSGLDGEFKGKTILGVTCLGGGGYVAEYDYTNDKLVVYYADYSSGADGALIEHPASALTATFTLLVIAV